MTREQQLFGLVALIVLLGAVMILAAWLHQHRQRPGKHRQEQTTVVREPEPGSFTAAVLNAEQAARQYREAVLIGNATILHETLHRLLDAYDVLRMAIAEREVAARDKRTNPLYASGPGSVSVAESDRLAGEPYTSPGGHHEVFDWGTPPPAPKPPYG